MTVAIQMNDLVTVAVFTYPHEMAVVRARLEWEGITCFAQDEHTVSAHPLYSNLIGGIKLRVPAGDVEQARSILIEAGHLQDGPDGPGATSGFWTEVSRNLRVPSIPPSSALRIAVGLLLMVILLGILFA